MKRLFLLFVLLAIMLNPLRISAEDFTYDHNVYSISDKSARTCALSKSYSQGVLVIPEHVVYTDVNSKKYYYTVTGVGPSVKFTEQIESVTIPSTVDVINSSAFSGCSNLKHIDIPESVRAIGGYAFNKCTSLSEINIPKSVTKIYDRTFEGCSNLSQINFHSNIQSIEVRAFADCKALTAVTISNPECEIANYAFSGTNIDDIYIDSSTPELFVDIIDKISETARVHIDPSTYNAVFSSDLTWKDRVVKEAFTVDGIQYSWNPDESNTLVITGFENTVESVTFNEYVYGLPIAAIGCNLKDYSSIKYIIYNRSAVPENFCKNMASLNVVNLGEQVTSIGEYAFYGVNLQTLTSAAVIPPSLGTNAFDISTSRPQLYVDSDLLTIYENDNNWNTLFDIYSFANNTNSTGWGYEVLPSSFLSVRLTSLPEDIDGDELIIPATIEVNGRTAQVMELNIVSIPAGKTFSTLRIEDSAYLLTQGCDLSKLISSSTVYIGRDIQPAADYEESLYGYNRITDVTFGSNVTKVSAKMFMGSTRIPSIDLSQTKVDSIGDFAFNKVSLLANLKLPSTLKYIGKQSFVGTRITELDLPETLTEIDEQAFYTCNNLTSVTINSPIKRIGNEAFASCNKLSNIMFNKTVGRIENGAFADLTFENIEVMADTIASGAFANIRITGDLKVVASSIETEAFRNATSGTGISLSTKTLPGQIFQEATLDNLKSIDIHADVITDNPFGTTEFPNVNFFHITSTEIQSRAFSSVILADGADIEINADYIGTYAFENMSAVNVINLTINAKETISEYAFSKSKISSEYPISITSNIIESVAFFNFGLVNTQLIVNINADYICDNAFQNSYALKEIYVTGNDCICGGAFRGSKYITYASLNIPSVSDLGLVDTYGAGKLETVDFGEKVQYISGFKNYSNLSVVNFNGCRLTNVSQNAFSGTNISSVIFPTIEGAEATCVIGDNAFDNYRIKYIDLGNTVKSVGTKCFSGPIEDIDLGCVQSLGNDFIYRGSSTLIFPATLRIPGTVEKLGTIGLYSSVKVKPRHIIFEQSDVPLKIEFGSSADISEAVLEFHRDVTANWNGTVTGVICPDNEEQNINVQICAADSIYLGSSVATATIAKDCAPSVLSINDGVEGIAVAEGAILTIPYVNFHIPASMKLMSGEITMPVDFNLNLADGDPDKVLDLTGLKFTADETSHPTLYCGRNIALDGYSLGRLNTWTTAVFGENVTAIGEHCFDGCVDLSTAVLSPSIKTIGNSAFKGCTGLGTIEFSENLETIDAAAYSGCTSIDKIVARGTVPAGGVFAFDDAIAETTPLYVPEESVNDYADSDNFIMFDIYDNIHSLADGGLIKDMELDNSEPVDEFFTAGSQCHLPTWLKILYHLYKKVTGQGAPARIAALAAAADGQPSNDDLLWVSSDPRVASIDREGNVTFHTSDPVTITAIATDGSGARLNITINKDILGDVNKDGVIDGIDLNTIISHITGSENSTINPNAADMNRDGAVDGLDLNEIITIITNYQK